MVRTGDILNICIDLLASEMCNFVECLSTITIFGRTCPGDQTNIDEFSEVVTEVEAVIVDSSSEFFTSDFLSLPKEKQYRVSSTITECCLTGSMVRECAHTVVEQPLINVPFEILFIWIWRSVSDFSGHCYVNVRGACI